MIRKQKFSVEGYELREKTVYSSKGTASRVLVPVGWKKVVIIKVE